MQAFKGSPVERDRGRWTLALSGFAAAALVGLISCALSYATMAGEARRMTFARTILVNLPEFLTWALTVPLIVWLARRLPVTGRGWPMRAAAHALFAAVIHIGSSALVILFYAPLAGDQGTFGDMYRQYLAWRWQLAFVVYIAVLSACAALDFWRAARDRELRAAHLETRLAEAKLDALRRRLDPHFLFNALQSASALVRKDPPGAQRTLALIGDLLRTVLSENRSQEIPLRQELDFLTRYVEIERTRLAERLRVNVEVEPDSSNVLVPAFVLQPLVENAIRHGIARRSEGGHVGITARLSGGRLRLTVHDDGPGPARTGADGIGLHTTRARLETLYGAAHQFTLDANPAGGTDAIIEIPARLATA